MHTLQIEKSYAMQLVNDHSSTRNLTNYNTNFSNVNTSKNVWWLDIPLEKIKSDREAIVNILLFESHSSKLYHLRVPKVYFREQISSFAYRADKNVISLELSADQFRLFQDVRPTSKCLLFAQFLYTSFIVVER